MDFRLISSVLRAALLLLFVDSAIADDEAAVTQTLKQHCLKCHGEDGNLEGEAINLDDALSAGDLLTDADLLAEIIDAVESERMPPDDEPRLDAKTLATFIKHLNGLLNESVDLPDNLPRTPIRRMNRFQYANAVQDLFDIKVEVFALPERMVREYGNYFQPQSGKMPDTLNAGSRPLGKSQLIAARLGGVAPFPQDLRAENGFDNRGDHLTLSPLLLESFLKLSRSIVESPDFNQKNCGIWDEFFREPAKDQDVSVVVRERLTAFLTRAFRRPISDVALERYASHVDGLIKSGMPFSECLKEVSSAAIASPRFLYLYDGQQEAAKTQLLNDYELASRLSFFLWGSIPDQTLLDLAAKKQLSDSDVLKEQLDRMLNDRRMKRFCDSFPAQWLQLERIISSVPDPNQFPEFYFAKFRVSMHMMLEPLLLFETILVEDRSVLQLIDADFSYRSDLLQKWYASGKQGKTPPTSIPFQRVAVKDRREGGVITNAAVMTMTSAPTRTQPITRGAWLASVIFNDPPKPPPADVPPLPEVDERDVASLTIRERLAVHRERADCAGCHAQIDPLGFALENYGPTGLWRDRYENGADVDTAGVLFGKHKFNDIVEFKEAILAEKDRFVRGFTEHLMSFALGREVSVVDRLAIDEIVKVATANEYRFRTLIKQIVLSQPFRTSYNP